VNPLESQGYGLMTRSAKNDIHNEQAETDQQSKRFRFDLGFKELFFYAFGLFLALSWMFVFGVLIGRGTPLVTPDDISVRAHLMRFLGLGSQADQQPQTAAAPDLDSPRKMLESLNYYEDLTQKNSAAPPSLRPVPPVSTAAPKQQQPTKETSTQKGKTPSGQVPQVAVESGSSPSLQGAVQEPGPPVSASGHFSLLVSSLKDSDNAQRLVDQLRSKGYSPRIETLNLSGSGRWNRVLVGSFQSREDALRFAAEFNRKEHMEGLVVRETQ
jgi:cell division septation protein DedD